MQVTFQFILVKRKGLLFHPPPIVIIIVIVTIIAYNNSTPDMRTVSILHTCPTPAPRILNRIPGRARMQEGKAAARGSPLYFVVGRASV